MSDSTLVTVYGFSPAEIGYYWEKLSGATLAGVVEATAKQIDANKSAKSIVMYLLECFDHGSNTLCVPAMIVATLVGQKYATAGDRKEFLDTYLKQDAAFVDHFTGLKKKTVFDQVRAYASKVEDKTRMTFTANYLQEGRNTPTVMAYVVDLNADAKSTTYHFLTPHFAMHLVAVNNEQVARFLTAFEGNLRKVDADQQEEYVQVCPEAQPQQPQPQPQQHPHPQRVESWVAMQYRTFESRQRMEAWEFEKVEKVLAIREREFQLQKDRYVFLNETLGPMTEQEKHVFRANNMNSCAMNLMRSMQLE